jgi:hypothetical protein
VDLSCEELVGVVLRILYNIRRPVWRPSAQFRTYRLSIERFVLRDMFPSTGQTEMIDRKLLGILRRSYHFVVRLVRIAACSSFLMRWNCCNLPDKADFPCTLSDFFPNRTQHIHRFEWLHSMTRVLIAITS